MAEFRPGHLPYLPNQPNKPATHDEIANLCALYGLRFQRITLDYAVYRLGQRASAFWMSEHSSVEHWIEAVEWFSKRSQDES